jgi:BMFP domain-containing protein YqiC
LGEERSIFDRLRERGEEVFTQLSGELMANPHFMRAMEGALRGKEFVDQAVARALKTMNVPTRGDLKKVLQRIETLEAEVAGLKKRAKAGAGARKTGAARGRRTGPARG